MFLFINYKTGIKKILFHISPGKTLESIGIMYILNIIVSLTLSLFRNQWLIPDLNTSDFFFLSLLVTSTQVSTTGLVGSTTGSFLKRVAMIKDLNLENLGTRGIFDQIDFLIVSMPGIYYYIIFFKLSN